MEQQILFDRTGTCILCGGTNICLTCDGSGEHPLLRDEVCPTCKGGGDCACHGQEKKTSPYNPEAEKQSLRAGCFRSKTRHKPLIE
jgi:hypothetical protein